ncbi:unnamed protein product, partial [Darwinula stevensoni]
MRTATVHRKTSETDIQVYLNIDGTGIAQLDTGVPFLDHMLDQIARHGLMDLTVKAMGDTHIDDHHTVEDVGITIGQAFSQALGDKKGICRYGMAYIPLDEALSRVVLDFSGRPGLEFHVPFTRARVGNFDVDLLVEFFRGFVNHAGVTLHIDNLRGYNAHHQCETVFKAFAKALRMACTIDERASSHIPSTKGLLLFMRLLNVLRGSSQLFWRIPQKILKNPTNYFFQVKEPCLHVWHIYMHLAWKHKPIFGVCVGQQMLFESSQEGGATCLGVYRGTVDRFAISDTLKVPHMGWNQVKQVQNHPMWAGIADLANFYFVHSYYVHPCDEQIILGSTQYGVDFASCVGKDNVFATQFHPEKSAIDIKDGKCVRLVQGDMDQVTIFSEDPIEMALKWVDLGAERLHLVDLDGAVAGKPKNEGLIKELIAEIGEDFPIQLGGGIRNLDTIESYLNDGLSYVIIGTAAIKSPGFLQDACLAFPRQIIVGLDAKDGKVATDGWSKMTGHDVIDLAKKYEDYGVESIIYTDIGRDGMLQGINWEATLRLAEAADIPVIASGGLAGMKDIEILCEHGQTRIEGVICGRAIYSGDLDFAKALDYVSEKMA